MKFEIIDNCPVPVQLADCVREIKRQTGATLASCDRSKEAEPYLRRLGKRSQRQLYDGWVRHLPGYNPANPPGFSTHERRNDGTAYPGPRGMVLRYWQVGMDWSDSDAVVRAAAKLGFTATRTYPRDQREHHHLNFRREPKLKLRRLLKLGSKGYRVAKMTRDLTIARGPDGKPYLDKRQGIFDEKVDAALRRFQKDWDQMVDGVYGEQTARQLAVAVRAAKRAAKEKKEVPVTPEQPKPEPAAPTALSPSGAKFIAKFEGFRSALSTTGPSTAASRTSSRPGSPATGRCSCCRRMRRAPRARFGRTWRCRSHSSSSTRSSASRSTSATERSATRRCSSG